jgi:hypothetical protein
MFVSAPSRSSIIWLNRGEELALWSMTVLAAVTCKYCDANVKFPIRHAWDEKYCLYVFPFYSQMALTFMQH